MAAKFEIRPAKDGFRFVLKAASGEVVSTKRELHDRIRGSARYRGG